MTSTEIWDLGFFPPLPPLFDRNFAAFVDTPSSLTCGERTSYMESPKNDFNMPYQTLPALVKEEKRLDAYVRFNS